MSVQISVIIPVYNTRLYLRRCLDSIKTQKFNDYEVLMVDDGSTDGSKDICQEYVVSDTRFRLICSSHYGCAESRNLGLSESKGQYITFIDSDDYVTDSYLSDLYGRMISHEGVDIVAQGITRVVGNKAEVRGKFMERTFHLPNCSDLFFSQFSVVTSGSVCAKLFRIDTIQAHRLRFHSEVKLAEDMGFLMEYLLYSNTIVLDASLDYFYVGNPMSTSTCYWDFIVEETGFLTLRELWVKLLKKYPAAGLYTDYSVFVGNFLNRMVYSNIIHPYSCRERKNNFKHLKDRYYPELAVCYQPKTLFTKLLKYSSLHEHYNFYAFLMKLAIWRYNLSVNFE